MKVAAARNRLEIGRRVSPEFAEFDRAEELSRSPAFTGERRARESDSSEATGGCHRNEAASRHLLLAHLRLFGSVTEEARRRLARNRGRSRRNFSSPQRLSVQRTRAGILMNCPCYFPLIRRN